ncbi:hypothetical protein ACIQMV_13555 [Streptomyces sp. NPDC091412]|uniref:hypothetical protein n=1 Tax=Streptomyces sp. NPDC091412 TaxID=3366002 RepID=UPI00380812EB
MGTVRDAGHVQIVFGSTTAVGQEFPSKGFVQGANQPLGGGPEEDDWRGCTVAAGTSPTGYPFLVIGVPGEDGAGGVDMGLIGYVYGTDFKAASVSQNSTGVWEEAEPYDRFGSSIAATDRFFVVGAPGESIGTVAFAGGVQAFRPSINSNGIPDPLFGMGQGRVPGPDSAAQTDDRHGSALAMAPYPRTYAGISLGSSPSALYVGVPYGPAEGHAVHAFPWNTASGGAPTQTWRSGEGGIPAGGAAFGAAV